jgi:ribulose-bisphosphate carboxylase large chain
VRSLLEPLGDTLGPVPTLSSGQNVTTAAPTYAAVRSTDLFMLAGGGVAAHPDGPAAGVRSLRDAWTAAIDGVPLQQAAQLAADTGDPALLHAVQKFGDRTPQEEN